MMPIEISSTLMKIVAGDAKAFRSFFDRYYPQVFGFALRLLKDEDDAEDVAQGIFIKLWIQRATLANITNLDGFLYRVTRNATLNFIASNKYKDSNVSVDSANSVSIRDNVEEVLEANDTQLLIDMVVNNLPSQRQKVYRMSREEHLTNDEIAQKLGLEKKTVENHLSLALRELRKALLSYFLLMLWV